MEKEDELTDEEIGEVCIQLRRLSPDVSINPQVRNAIHSFWHNVPAAMQRVKNAIALMLLQATDRTIRADIQE